MAKSEKPTRATISDAVKAFMNYQKDVAANVVKGPEAFATVMRMIDEAAPTPELKDAFSDIIAYEMEKRLPSWSRDGFDVIDLKDGEPLKSSDWHTVKAMNEAKKQTFTKRQSLKLHGVSLKVEHDPGPPVFFKGYVDGKYVVRGSSRPLVRDVITAMAWIHVARFGAK